jgi:6-pyruvoyltetrahydropterin/6-carboxytetrahydropterin synthase
MPFQIRVTRSFSARHALRLPDGSLEPVHGHGWPVTVVCQSDVLDGADCVVDFHDVQRQLDAIFKPWHGRTLNDCEPFRSGVNPSAERVAETIGRSITLEPRVRLVSVEIGEADGCVAVWLNDE